MSHYRNNSGGSLSVIIENGQLRSPSDFITVDNNNITLSPLRDSQIDLCVINDDNQSRTQNIHVNFHEPHASVRIFGLYVAKNHATIDIKTKMNHVVPHCKSEQLWKGVLHDDAKATFEGNIVVAPHAQKTIAHLQNKNLLLSKNAEIHTRPFLEINANDVQCTHGATVGFLDAQALFYLRSRGIPEQEARQVLIDAFVREILDRA